MCPQSIEEFYGQKHILGKGKLLYRMIKADRLSSIIFFGPPGTGKTSLARIIAKTTNTNFEMLNAVSSGVSDIKRVVDFAENTLMDPSAKVVLFIGEIHRFNKAQQHALLPSVEKGSIILIGATTENPFFEVNGIPALSAYDGRHHRYRKAGTHGRGARLRKIQYHNR